MGGPGRHPAGRERHELDTGNDSEHSRLDLLTQDPSRLHRRREQTPLGGGLRFPPAADTMQLFVDQHLEAVTAEQSARPDQERLTKYSHVTPFPGFTNSSHCAGSPAAANCSSA